jgi:type VII secretion-associated serine protease mycosin
MSGGMSGGMSGRISARRLVSALTAAALVAAVAFVPGRADAAPGPPEAPEWWFDTWQVPTLWASGADGRGITVAVVDTGVQANIPELNGKVLAGADFIGNGTDGRTDFDSDEFSHGTAMASIIAASQGSFGIEGLAPAVKILPIAVPLKGVIKNGVPTPNATSESIRYAADHGAKIISMSLGGFVYEGEDPLPCPQRLQEAVIYALNKGSLVVAASGNSGTEGSPVEEPGVCLGVVSVGSVNSGLNVSAFSSRHPYLTMAAPGDQIPTLNRNAGRAFVGGGTSQATAITSAALALVWSKFPKETNRQILSRVLTTVTDRGPKGRDPSYGLGVINPEAALTAKVTATSANPVFDGAQPLISLLAASPAKPPTKAAAGNATAPIGQFSIGKNASVLGTEFLALAATAALCTLLALVLLILGLRRRTRPLRFT